MEKQILMISSVKGFMVNAIVNGLKREGYAVETVDTDVNAISKIENPPKIWVLYLNDDIAKQSEAMVYIRDALVEDEKFFYMVGNPEELGEAGHTITSDLVTGKFERPLNVKDLSDAIDKSFEKGTEAEARKRVLVVDDDPTMTRAIKNLLSDKYTVFMAASGMNAITFLAKTNVDLILLDYEMPVISGAKVLEMIRSEESTRNIPVMFLTGKSDKESVMNVLALKPEAYLLKSMPPAEWIKTVDNFFNTGKA